MLAKAEIPLLAAKIKHLLNMFAYILLPILTFVMQIIPHYFSRGLQNKQTIFQAVLLCFLFAFSYKIHAAFHHFSTGNYILDCLLG